MRLAAVTTLAAALAATAALPARAQANVSPAPATDYVKRAGNFLKNCDARADTAGERPEPNYVCLAFMAGLIEGYTYAAVANGNPQPYCLPRPASLAELSDMMATVIERGVPPDLPTAAVFHFILQENFKCAPDPDQAGDAGDLHGRIELAQAEQLLKVTPPAEVGASERKLPIVKPAGPAGRSSEPLLKIVDPSRAAGAVPSGDTTLPTTPTPRASPARPQTASDTTTVPEPPDEPASVAEGAAETPEAPIADAPINLPGTATGPTSASGPATAVGPSSAEGFSSATGPQSAVGPANQLGPDSAQGPVAVPLEGVARPYAAPVIQVDPLAQRRGTLAAPVAPVGPARPQGPRRATDN